MKAQRLQLQAQGADCGDHPSIQNAREVRILFGVLLSARTKNYENWVAKGKGYFCAWLGTAHDATAASTTCFSEESCQNTAHFPFRCPYSVRLVLHQSSHTELQYA